MARSSLPICVGTSLSHCCQTPGATILRGGVVAWLAISILFVWSNTPALAQQERDLADLSLQELMDLDVLFVNVLGTHTHLAGEWMIGYKLMFMRMDGNRDGTERISDDEVLEDFPVTPTNMDMAMHMVEVMYAPSDDLTLMVMVPFVSLSMDHLTRTGVRFTTESGGIGDITLAGLYTFYGDVRTDRHRLLLNAGVTVPTGSIDERDDTPAGNLQLPYPMQVGSGTVDLLPGLTYLGESEDWAWVVQGKGVIRLGENSNDYRLGHQFHFDGWGARKVTDWASVSAQLSGRVWGDVDGADPDLNPKMVPTADPNLRGGERVDFLFGFNAYAQSGTLEGNRAAVEVGFPVYQSLDGPQLETDWRWTAVWNWTF